MSIASRLTRLPRPYDPDRGAEARAAVPEATGDVARLIEGAGGCSPYLKSLIEKESGWLLPALDDPEKALDALHHDLTQTAPDALADALRQGKRRVALLTALADLSGAWTLEEVTGALTRFADLSCQMALRASLGAEIKRGKLPGMTADDAETGASMVALAMGKMGAFELNYSSDIDLICLFDESRFDPDDYHEARASLIRATRKMAGMLSDNTAQGYVFRTDLRLRPDPSVTPVCMSMEAAERYYESLGRTWERAAYIKARPAAGDLAAGDSFLKTLRPFVWRRHLDFAAIQDAHDMRLRIRAHKGLGGAVVLAEHNMKLGRGGIREIEFFTQTRQIIAGGRDPDLQVRGTVAGLDVLARKGWIPQDVAQTLAGHYRAHREVEHRLQMINDAQTHSLPRSPEGFARLAAFMGVSQSALEADLTARLSEVHELTEGFFTGSRAVSDAAQTQGGAGRVGAAKENAVPGLAEDPVISDQEAEITSRWRSYPALRSERAQEIFHRLRPEIMSRLARTANPAEALTAFDGFLAGLPAGVQLFSLFDVNPQLIDLLVDIVGSSPALAQHLSRNSAVFDAVIGGGFFAPWPEMDVLQAELSARMENEADYEAKLDAARRWAKEWHFRIGVHHLRGLIDADAAGPQYADLAEAALRALWPVVVAQFAAKHGAPPGRGAMVLGMGSLGAGRLNAESDLDLIVIYDADGLEMSDGRRPLAARPYYARLTQALVTAVTAPTAQGRLYEIDMRLRPSGTQGPVATSLASFRDYQMSEAWVWEHLALTRARPVAGDADVARDVVAVRDAVLERGHSRAKIVADVTTMRDRIAAAKTAEGPWDAKLGRGRLQDVELMAQAASLMARAPARGARDGIAAGVACGWLHPGTGRALTRAYLLFWHLQLVAKLLSDKSLDPDRIGEGGCRMLLRETGQPDLETLAQEMVDVAAAADAAITAALADGLVDGEGFVPHGVGPQTGH